MSYIKNQTKNETEIQLMKILFKTGGKRATKNMTSKRAYPHGVEAKFYRQLKSFFKPLTDYVNKYINENLEPLLRGDSDNVRLDTIPGSSYRGMVYNLEEWLTAYMPDISEIKNLSNNIILTSLGKTADEAMDFETTQFQKTIEKGIHVNLPTSAEWWNNMKSSWAEDNYTLITSNAKKFVSEINTLTEQAIVNGMSPAKLKSQIKKATEGLSDKHCKLLARDQMGKLNGQITQAQMEEIDLEMYVWDTSMDDRVRESHQLMQGVLCRWDDASVCSYDNGKTWEPRPAGAIDLHPGQDIQCRCVALAFYPELISEVEDVPMEEVMEDDPYTSELMDNYMADLSDEEKSIYKDCYDVFSEYDGNRNNAIEISYACATGDFTKLPTSVLNANELNWANLENKIRKSMELYSNKDFVVNQFQIARDIYQKGGKLPNFTCTQKELDNYITYLKQTKAFNSYEEMAKNNYGYEKYFALASKLPPTSTVGKATYYSGLLDYMELKNTELLKKSYDGFVNENKIFNYSQAKNMKYFDKCLSTANIKIGNFNINHLMGITEEAGTPWGTADINNDNFKSIAMFDHKISPFNKKTQQLTNVKFIDIDSKVAQQGIANKLYCDNNYPLSRKLSTKSITTNLPAYKGQKFKYHDDEFLRIEFSYNGRAKNYKVGDILKQSGVFATSPSEFHNAYWYDKKLAIGASHPVRFHLKRDATSHKYLSNIIQNDLHKAHYTANNPEEFDFALGKVKVVKVEDGFINNNKNYPIKEVYVEIVE